MFVLALILVTFNVVVFVKVDNEERKEHCKGDEKDEAEEDEALLFRGPGPHGVFSLWPADRYIIRHI